MGHHMNINKHCNVGHRSTCWPRLACETSLFDHVRRKYWPLKSQNYLFNNVRRFSHIGCSTVERYIPQFQRKNFTPLGTPDQHLHLPPRWRHSTICELFPPHNFFAVVVIAETKRKGNNSRGECGGGLQQTLRTQWRVRSTCGRLLQLRRNNDVLPLVSLSTLLLKRQNWLFH